MAWLKAYQWPADSNFEAIPSPLGPAVLEPVLQRCLVSTDEDECDGTFQEELPTATIRNRKRRFRPDRTRAAQAVYNMLDQAADVRLDGRYKVPAYTQVYSPTSKLSVDGTFTLLAQRPELQWAYTSATVAEQQADLGNDSVSQSFIAGQAGRQVALQRLTRLYSVSVSVSLSVVRLCLIVLSCLFVISLRRRAR